MARFLVQEGEGPGGDGEGGGPEAPPTEGGEDERHLRLSPEVSRHWFRPEGLREHRKVVFESALIMLERVLARLRRTSVIGEIEAQLSRDSEELESGLVVNVRFEIQEDDYWKGYGLAGLTLCGDPVAIYLNLETLADFTEEQAVQAIIHELLHVKHCAYTDAGLPSPYPEGHDDPAFKEKERELGKKAGLDR